MLVALLKNKSKTMQIGPLIFSRVEANVMYRSSLSAVFLRKGVLKVCSRFTGEHPMHKRKKLKNDNSKYRKNIYGQPIICNIDFIKKVMQCH